jgi:hypothetical protein
MRRSMLSLVLFSLLAACSRQPAATPPTTAAVAKTTYGVVTDGPTLTPAQVLAAIDEHDGKTVRVAGTVGEVCEKRGCWMGVVGEGGETIRIKVKDGEVVFPVSARGKKVVAEGIAVKIPADPSDDPASCGTQEGHDEGHADCARPAGASARVDGTGATIIDAS